MADLRRMILDVDTGIDDALVLHHAVRHPDIRLEAVTTVYGNTDVAIATDNTLKALELVGRPDIPVAKGVGRSLLKALLTDDDMRKIVDKGDVAAKTLMRVTQFYAAAYMQRQPLFGGCP